jgi:hypothetical protein
MIADYMTKPLVGTKFIHFRQQIMNSKWASVSSRSVLEKIF